MFHAREGWYFERVTLGGVRIISPNGEITLDNDTWCSILAAVSPKGDTAESFKEAKDFHNKGITNL